MNENTPTMTFHEPMTNQERIDYMRIIHDATKEIDPRRPQITEIHDILLKIIWDLDLGTLYLYPNIDSALYSIARLVNQSHRDTREVYNNVNRVDLIIIRQYLNRLIEFYEEQIAEEEFQQKEREYYRREADRKIKEAMSYYYENV